MRDRERSHLLFVHFVTLGLVVEQKQRANGRALQFASDFGKYVSHFNTLA